MLLDHSNTENYRDPILYDLESGRLDLDDTFLLDIALQTKGPVLELGCGTGRATIPLAKAGVEMTGLDSSSEMLDHARFKAGSLSIRWIQEDVRSFQLDAKYPLIFTYGAVFQHLLSRGDQEGMLARVREHLTLDGRFIIDASFPKKERMVDVLEETDWFSYIDNQGRKVQVSGTDRYDHVNQIWHQTMYRRWPEQGGRTVTDPVRLALRYFMPEELERTLHNNGFMIRSRSGDWAGNPLTMESDMQVYVCVLA